MILSKPIQQLSQRLREAGRSFWEAARRDRGTLPPADARIEKVALGVTLVASLWFALVAGWEMGGPFGAGHLAAGTAFAVAAENSLQWGILAPVPLSYSIDPPHPIEYYCHHPWGLFWVMAAFLKVLGHHDWVVRAPAVLMSCATPPLIYAVARSIWGPIAGAVAAASFVTLPITLAFANLSNLEVPVMFGVLLATLGYVRFSQTWRKRWFWVGLFGVLFAICIDWPGLLFAAAILAFLAVRGFLLGRFFPPVDARGFARFWAFASCLGVAVLLLHIYWFSDAGQLEDFVESGASRSVGADKPLSEVLESRKYWIELSFTPLAIALGKLMAPILALRVLLLRRDHEAFVLAILVMATVHYVVFKNGADVHIFWSQYFGLYYALAMGALVASVQGISGKLAELGARQSSALALLTRPSVRTGALYASLVVGLAPSLTIAPDGLRGLIYGRISGGRFDQKGLLLLPDKDKVSFIEWLSSRMPSRTGAVLHPNMKQSVWLAWSLRRPVKSSMRPPTTPGTGIEQYYLLDSRLAESSELRRLSNAFKVTAVGPFWAVDRGAAIGPIEGHVVARREPAGFEWYWRSSFHALRSVVPDAFMTWELRDHLDQTPNPEPRAVPDADEQLRIAHNLALHRGDSEGAARLLEKLLAGADRSIATVHSDGTELLATKYQAGASRLLTVYFRAGEPSEHDPDYTIYSTVVRKRDWSLVPADTQVKDVGVQSHLPRGLWKRGYLYSTVTEIVKRPGTERYFGSFRGAGAARAIGPKEPITLLELE